MQRPTFPKDCRVAEASIEQVKIDGPLGDRRTVTERLLSSGYTIQSEAGSIGPKGPESGQFHIVATRLARPA